MQPVLSLLLVAGAAVPVLPVPGAAAVLPVPGAVVPHVQLVPGAAVLVVLLLVVSGAVVAGGWRAAMYSAAASALAAMGSNQVTSPGVPVTSVAMIRPSSLVTFWVL